MMQQMNPQAPNTFYQPQNQPNQFPQPQTNPQQPQFNPQTQTYNPTAQWNQNAQTGFQPNTFPQQTQTGVAGVQTEPGNRTAQRPTQSGETQYTPQDDVSLSGFGFDTTVANVVPPTGQSQATYSGSQQQTASMCV
jgi:hypothetical protein